VVATLFFLVLVLMECNFPQRNLIEVKGVLKETEVREACCLDEIEELKKTIQGLEGDMAVWSEKYNQTEQELQGVKLRLDEEENGRVEAQGLSAERLEEIERLRGEYEELVKSSSETSEALEAQLVAMTEAKEVAELAVAEMRRPETDSESDGDSGSMSGSGDELGSMPGSRRRGGSKKGSTTSSRRSSDTKSSSKRQVKELTIKCADLEREILKLKNEAKQFSAGTKALEQLPELKSQISSLETRLEMQDGERRKQVSAVQAANKQIAELKQALHDGRRHADELGQTIKRLEGEVVVLNGRIVELEGEVERRDGMIERLESQLREARDENGVLRGRNEGLEGELADARGGWEASKEEVAKLIKSREELMEEGSGMRGERDALAGELSRAKLMIERLEGDVRKKDKHRVEIDKQVSPAWTMEIRILKHSSV
jgi:chromosome segregation ATPase